MENVVELMNTINRLSSNIQIHVNLYDPHGRLMFIPAGNFERHLLGARMNWEAFRMMQPGRKAAIHSNRTDRLAYLLFHVRSIVQHARRSGGVHQHSYLSGQTDVTKDTSSIVAAIVNLYLLYYWERFCQFYIFKSDYKAACRTGRKDQPPGCNTATRTHTL